MPHIWRHNQALLDILYKILFFFQKSLYIFQSKAWNFCCFFKWLYSFHSTLVKKMYLCFLKLIYTVCMSNRNIFPVFLVSFWNSRIFVYFLPFSTVLLNEILYANLFLIFLTDSKIHRCLQISECLYRVWSHFMLMFSC